MCPAMKLSSSKDHSLKCIVMCVSIVGPMQSQMSGYPVWSLCLPMNLSTEISMAWDWCLPTTAPSPHDRKMDTSTSFVGLLVTSKNRWKGSVVREAGFSE